MSRTKGFGMIRKRDDGRWEGRCAVGTDPINGRTKYRSVYGRTQKEVRQMLTQMTAELDEGIYVEPTKLKVGAWLDLWLKDYTLNLKPATRSAYEEHVRVHLKPYLGEVRLTRLAPQMVQALYNRLLGEKQLSPKTIYNIHGAFHRAMEQAKVLGFLRTNPLDGVVLPRVEKKQVNTVTDDAMVAFLQAIQGDPYELVLFVTAFTGMR